MLSLTYTANGFSIFFNNQLRLYHHNTDLPLFHFGEGKAIYSEHLGSYKIKETLQTKSAVSNFSLIQDTQTSIRIQFTLGSESFQMNIVEDSNQMQITFDNIPSKYNRFWINLPASPTEAIYGGGEQFSEFNLAHQKVPLWVQEQGIGRKGFTAFVANLAEGAGGSKFHTYYPQPTFVSLDNYYCHFDQSAFGVMHFHYRTTPRPFHQFHFWQIPKAIFIGVFQNFIKTVSALNLFLGLQPKLPNWVYSGMWLAIQGENGLDSVRSRLQKALDAGVNISAIWSQDWQGILKTTFGTQLFWDWKWDGPNRKIRFPNFPDFVKEVRKKGIRYLGYINPFLYEKGALFQEAKEKGYLIKTKAGDLYITKTTTFNVGLLDLTNPEVTQWIKSVIKKNMIEEAGLSGWMADFGEYLPIEGELASGEDPEIIHNQYPVLWDKVNLEAIEEAGKLGEIVYFTRSGYSNSSRYTTLVWAGDQMVNWEYHDGLASVIPAALSLGMCGIGYHCSDIGGFTSLKWIRRSKELFLRWVEQATFTMIMRTHESNRPEECWQFDSDQETLDHLARMTRIHTDLTPYLQSLSDEYQSTGIPPLRPLVLHYPGDPLTISIKYQYLLGQDLLVAPVLKKNKKKWKVYLPNDSWLHLWSEDEYTGGTITIEAPWGYPPIFYRKESKFKKIFSEIAKRFGLYSL
jgi:alpha-glucosidase